jgi:hypothetical protein
MLPPPTPKWHERFGIERNAPWHVSAAGFAITGATSRIAYIVANDNDVSNAKDERYVGSSTSAKRTFPITLLDRADEVIEKRCIVIAVTASPGRSYASRSLARLARKCLSAAIVEALRSAGATEGIIAAEIKAAGAFQNAPPIVEALRSAGATAVESKVGT